MRIILADDRAPVRSALRLLLRYHPGVEIVGEAVDTRGLLDWVKATCPDLVLLDWELPGLAPATLLPLLREQCPDLRVIAFSSKPEVRRAALEAGADLFVSKGDPPEEVLAAVDRCREGEQENV
ncbi:MAG: response regulator transcription factor [Anaerolineae bacterium]|jgi:DNA-binding NarL/FixJ family response regulator